MAKGHRHIGAAPAWHLKPRHQTFRCMVCAFFHTEIHRALRIAKTHARECVDDHPQTVGTLQVIAPLVW